MQVKQSDPGNMVETAILPGTDKNFVFIRNGAQHYLMFVIKPSPGNIVSRAILLGIDESGGKKVVGGGIHMCLNTSILHQATRSRQLKSLKRWPISLVVNHVYKFG